MEQYHYWAVLGTIFAGLGVALGAFGAHALEGSVSADRLSTFETGVRYQMYHALALLALAALSKTYTDVSIVGWLWVAGIIIFSGSLYLLVLTDTSWFGAITPIGGIAFIAGWGLFLYRIVQQS